MLRRPVEPATQSGHRRIQAMLAEIKADMAAQLERVRAMEASGELESIPDIN